MLNNSNPLLIKAEWCRYSNHFSDLNLNHVKVVEAMGLKVIASRSPAMASAPYKISSKSVKRLKRY
jgi:hypothetical protein